MAYFKVSKIRKSSFGGLHKCKSCLKSLPSGSYAVIRGGYSTSGRYCIECSPNILETFIARVEKKFGSIGPDIYVAYTQKPDLVKNLSHPWNPSFIKKHCLVTIAQVEAYNNKKGEDMLFYDYAYDVNNARSVLADITDINNKLKYSKVNILATLKTR